MPFFGLFGKKKEAPKPESGRGESKSKGVQRIEQDEKRSKF